MIIATLLYIYKPFLPGKALLLPWTKLGGRESRGGRHSRRGSTMSKGFCHCMYIGRLLSVKLTEPSGLWTRRLGSQSAQTLCGQTTEFRAVETWVHSKKKQWEFGKSQWHKMVLKKISLVTDCSQDPILRFNNKQEILSKLTYPFSSHPVLIGGDEQLVNTFWIMTPSQAWKGSLM